MKELFTFDDVIILDQFSEIASRGDVDLEVRLSGFPVIKLPVIAANMDTITGPEMAKAMIKYGAQACLHRFGSIEDTVKIFKEATDGTLMERTPFVSIGLGDMELARAIALRDAGAQVFVIDVAHGGQESVARQAKELRAIVGPYSGIVVGNFANPNTLKTFLEYVGTGVVNAVKIGIGPGSACTTRIMTGVGYPQFSAIQHAAQLLKNTDIAVIADGGMREPMDIAKALGAGASLVMLGGMLAGTDETPGEIVEQGYGGIGGLPLPKFKKYRGSASQESYEAQGKKGDHRTAEGESFLVPYKGPVASALNRIKGGLNSSFTYNGARNLKEFQSKVEFGRVTPNTVKENGAHGKK